MEGTSNPYKSGTEYEQSKAYNADIVIIMLGTNDSKNWNEENYKTQMTAFYNEYKTENNKVIFCHVSEMLSDDGKRYHSGKGRKSLSGSEGID